MVPDPAFRSSCFFFNDTATTEIYTLSLHDALPISALPPGTSHRAMVRKGTPSARRTVMTGKPRQGSISQRSEEHTSELQSQFHLVCRLLLEKKNKRKSCMHNACNRHDSYRRRRCG